MSGGFHTETEPQGEALMHADTASGRSSFGPVAKYVDARVAPSDEIEWLETNGLGDYATGTGDGCNTRRYHSLLTVNVPGLDRHVMLSTLEDWLVTDEGAFPLSARVHPGCVYPHGRDNLVSFGVVPCPSFTYETAGFSVRREVALVHGTHVSLVHYTVRALTDRAREKGATLRVSPLLACRPHHALTRANMDLQVKTYPAVSGFKIQPYNSLPPLFFQVDGLFDFLPSPEWIRNVDYPVERARGFEYEEDLFSPGLFEIHVLDGDEIVLSCSTSELAPGGGTAGAPRELWREETARRERIGAVVSGEASAPGEDGTSANALLSVLGRGDDAHGEEAERSSADFGRAQTRAREDSPLLAYLASRMRDFTMTVPSGRTLLLAGFPWFGSWGRDTGTALPGATFLAGRPAEGLAVLKTLAEDAQGGIVPNTYDGDGHPGGYNSADASLWFAWDCQMFLELLEKAVKDEKKAAEKASGRSSGKEASLSGFARLHAAFLDLCAPAVYSIVEAYRKGCVPFVREASSHLLEVGTPDTQLTWMDAQVDGVPVTPRNGFPVEIQALWYNTLAFAHRLAVKRGDPDPCPVATLKAVRASFRAEFCLPDGTLLDVWRPREEGGPDFAVRPNQLLAVSLPEAIAPDECFGPVVEKVRELLLTPFGLRTLSPEDPDFHPSYGGGVAERDGAYHQGTVWPWLLGAYTDALVKSLRTGSDADGGRGSRTRKAVRGLLDVLTPLVTEHLHAACAGHISEIFSATPPYAPDGAVAQAWSEAEVYRSLLTLRKADKAAFREWEAGLPFSGTAGRKKGSPRRA